MSGRDELRAARARRSRPAGADVRASRLSAVAEAVPAWAWRGWMPAGMLTLLVGQPGTGKTTLAMELLANVTRGELDGDLLGQPADALVLSYEDSLSRTIVPRLRAAGADLDRVSAIHCAETGYTIDLTSQLADIERIVAATGAKLLVIDPLVGGLPAGELNTYRDADVRSALAPIVTLAERHDLAVVGLAHFSKSATSALLGVGGSIGFAGLARSIVAFGDHPEGGDGERVVAHAKCNVGRLQRSRRVVVAGYPLTLEDGTAFETSVAIVGEEVDVSADDLVQAGPAKTSKGDRAAEFLEELLSDGPHKAAEVYNLAEGAGLSKRTLHRAKADLDVTTFQRDRHWWWRLDGDADEDGE